MVELQATRWGPASGTAARQLVVICHGVGANGQDLIDLAPHWGHALPDAVFAAPDAPEPYDGAPFGRQWWAIGDRDPARMTAGAAAARPLLDAFIDGELTRLGLPADAYALMGFSQGAMMVLYAGLRRSTAPKTIMAYSGALIAPEQLAARTKGRWNAMSITAAGGEPGAIAPGSEEEFITEHYWGYNRQRDGGTMEYAVEHPRWRVWKARDYLFDCDVRSLYGERFAPGLAARASSAFLVEGAPVSVRQGRRI